MSGGVAALTGGTVQTTGVAAGSVMAQVAAPGSGRSSGAILYRLGNNENNYGLAPAAFEALKGSRDYANRYGGELVGRLTDAVAQLHGVPREHLLLAPGSGEILRAVTAAFTGPTQALLTAAPSYESPVRAARDSGAPVRAVPVAADGTLDLDAMAAAAGQGTGLAFICNPNNPTGGSNPAAAVREFLARFRAASPAGYVLMDEAYVDYVTDPAYATAIPLVDSDPRVIVSRTFSKIHGMAGLRVGYAIGHPDALRLVRARTGSGTLSSASAAAALASLNDTARVKKQRELNREVRAFTRQAFERAGYTVLPSDANFVMVDVRRESTEFQQLCRAAGVAIARPFPPLTTHARISIGTAEEMRKALALMLPLLSAPARTPPALDGVDPWLPDDEIAGC